MTGDGEMEKESDEQTKPPVGQGSVQGTDGWATGTMVINSIRPTSNDTTDSS